MTLASGVELPSDAIAGLCRRYRVRELSVFGSAVRDELRPYSDIDLLVSFHPAARIGMFEYAGLMLDLCELLHRKVDLVEKEGLKKYARDEVLAEARVIYAG